MIWCLAGSPTTSKESCTPPIKVLIDPRSPPVDRFFHPDRAFDSGLVAELTFVRINDLAAPPEPRLDTKMMAAGVLVGVLTGISYSEYLLMPFFRIP